MGNKVVFLDVDGTLVNGQGEIPESARYAIQKAKENGHKMVVCSGRSLFQIQEDLLELGFSGIISSAGAFVIADDQEIYHARIDEEHRKLAAEYLDRKNAIYFFQMAEGMVISGKNKDRLLEYGKKLKMDEAYVEQFLGSLYVQEQAWDNENEEKIVYFESDASVEQMHRDLLPYFDVVPGSMIGADEKSGEIGINGINKATAMRIYLEHVGIARENCVAIGDGPNDLQMMEYAGTGVAMGNAREEVKERADLVTADIDDDGIWKAFEALGLIRENQKGTPLPSK